MTKNTVALRGMTWNHPRGWQPLEACSALWQERTGVAITWDRRSLQEFETFPVDQLAREYDLIVIDHPHVGQVARENCLLPLPQDRLADIAAGSVGASHPSYFWQGKQWALAIDAATQVQAWRPDRLTAPAANWEQVLELARAGYVALPLRSPHALMCLYTLTAQLGAPGRVEGPELFEPETASVAIELLRALLPHLADADFTQDPIAVFERMALDDSPIRCVPLIYGYVNYAVAGFRPGRIGFSDIPSLRGRGPSGSALGGTGIAVSARGAHTQEALDFALWVAGPQAQSGPYVASGGQAGHARAWEDDGANAATHDFYRATRRTLEGAWVRPRHDGYMPYQDAASERLMAGLRGTEPAGAIVADLNRMFRETLPR
ncbi:MULTISPECIES: carbohydrate ABC transporter substrate-binding protein [Ramlibacter]|uniref:Carbohydrate ABC transporter substrate-binding protein n=1 Tax=Ramlibacter pinisoli TaxID=2682844 RepID=A0A6N8IWB6_9BURK|nr:MULTISPECIES: carbohydrate ABC transporter substrate-binding protein [Ramlibacter]MBA2961017.1 carbohydrate ABC transporter substrate-binding protein [Ramlibacter sp. CGMCC 1.13660]MVQ30962.1 carbohydrate ABC transporter substrate-binding protein [Ramlibacter pinisoli]